MTTIFPSKKLGQKEKEILLGWGLVFPAVFVILSMILYPIIYNIYLSFFDVNLHEGNTFIGLENHKAVLIDPFFWKSVMTTVIYVFFTTIGTTLFGLIVAIAMNQEFPLRGLVRSLVLFPYVAPVISVVFAWQFIFDPVNGIVMDVLVERLGFLNERVNLIGSPSSAVWVAIVFSIWKNFPFTYLMILARLQGIDNNLFEAAEVDGASGWEKFRFITLPEIYFVTGSIILLRVIWNFNKFEEIYLLTTNVKVLSIYTYFKAFVGTMDMGQGAALALIQFILLIGFILIYVKKVLKW
ncbi:carbohydrate ABC transporter permease [Oceanispirochaeta sp.]|uniref:carbohydrate ABC transporter permease n=1 Tax=Oceanispirochaeta sp. TaxID=2035350 RepID=UPI002639D72F|nr:sugar ABC transporter permease [Oceanispirochaeta sp.]MDA3959041.1 sugar ABC transporter permease [Oceanispirochaeta sp.]